MNFKIVMPAVKPCSAEISLLKYTDDLAAGDTCGVDDGHSIHGSITLLNATVCKTDGCCVGEGHILSKQSRVPANIVALARHNPGVRVVVRIAVCCEVVELSEFVRTNIV